MSSSPTDSLTPKDDSFHPESGSNTCSVSGADKPRRRTKRTRARSPETVNKIKRTRRTKANKRERTRMHSLNDALDELRLMLPQNTDETKLTKIETLKYAYNYIYALSETLNNLQQRDTSAVPDMTAEAAMTQSYCAYNHYQSHFSPPTTESMLKTEPIWREMEGAVGMPFQASAMSNLRTMERYDYYSEVSCSPHSSGQSEWSSVYSGEEDSPIKYSIGAMYQDVPAQLMFDIDQALTNCQ